jgi:hypothetical protein
MFAALLDGHSSEVFQFNDLSMEGINALQTP